MADSTELVRLMKQAALDAVNASKPAEICFGKVTSASPLKILVEQKMTLGAAQLVLSRHVTDYITTVSIPTEYGWVTQSQSGGSGEAAFASHNHNIIINRQKITVHNGLAVGDEVILIRQQGGQKYIVWDRIG